MCGLDFQSSEISVVMCRFFLIIHGKLPIESCVANTGNNIEGEQNNFWHRKVAFAFMTASRRTPVKVMSVDPALYDDPRLHEIIGCSGDADEVRCAVDI